MVNYNILCTCLFALTLLSLKLGGRMLLGRNNTQRICACCRHYKSDVQTYDMDIFMPKEEAIDQTVDLCTKCVVVYKKKLNGDKDDTDAE